MGEGIVVNGVELYIVESLDLDFVKVEGVFFFGDVLVLVMGVVFVS